MRQHLWARRVEPPAGKKQNGQGHQLARETGVPAGVKPIEWHLLTNRALDLVVAWRIAYPMRMGCTCPDLGAKLFFDPDQIRAAYRLNQTGAATGLPYSMLSH